MIIDFYLTRSVYRIIVLSQLKNGREKMEFLGNIGGLLVFIGIAMFVLPLMGLTLSFMGWMYTWGETNAMLIKIGFIVVGAILWFLGNRAGGEGYEEE